MNTKLRFVPLFLIALMLLSIGCAKAPATNQEICTMDISVWYRERIMLPPGSTLTVKLEDVSRMDVAATVLSEETIQLETAPPYAVQLRYDCQSIDEIARYSIRARIENNGKLLFINTSAVDPFAGDPEKPVEVMVQRVAR